MSHLLGTSFFAILSMQALSAATPTFYKDVLPILQSRCQGCHRPGRNRADAFADVLAGASIRRRDSGTRPVRLKKMPPWGADPAHGRSPRFLPNRSGDRDVVRLGVGESA